MNLSFFLKFSNKLILIENLEKTRYNKYASKYIIDEQQNLAKGILRSKSVDIFRNVTHIFNNTEPRITKKIYGMISAKIDFNMLHLNIKYTKIGEVITLINVLKGVGINNIEDIATNENRKIYKCFCFLVESILSIVVNNKVVIVTSIIAKGILIILTSISFSVVNAVHIVCKISIFYDLHYSIFILCTNVA